MALLVEQLQSGRIVRIQQDFESDVGVENRIEGAPHNAHASFAQLFLQLVAAFGLLRHGLEMQEQLLKTRTSLSHSGARQLP
ncbi:MAG: hypothetical protein PW789_16825 [Edaphobacter sp.]|uniref:hypothetical protein n=1 Tax=Edaphobacter sp. TaxID=1934404 RepID=UPI002391EE18|nr:hypothetical protein [Edaphobacter sp.]MDE1178240.1 hypothetical protein [Edaphobacter sp.]